jgi:predicted amidohydrolase
MERKRQMIASAIQITAVDGEKQATIEKMSRLLDVAGSRGSDLVVLPELWTGLGFSDETVYREIAETIPGPVTEMLAEKARRYGMYVAGSMYEHVGQ